MDTGKHPVAGPGIPLTGTAGPRRVSGPAARQFLRQARGEAPACPRCAGQRLYTLRDGRLRCPCGYTFAEFAGTWLSRVKLSAEAWFAVLRHFAAVTPVEDAAASLQLANGTVFKAFRTIRLAILASSADAPALLDQDGELGLFCLDGEAQDTGTVDCHTCRSPVFGIMQDAGRPRAELFGQMRARDLFGLPAAAPLAMFLDRTVVFTGPFHGYAGLVFACCRTARQAFRHRFAPEPDPAQPLCGPHGFMTFSGRWLERYHCLAPRTFPLYLKEFELRFAHQGRPLLPALARCLARTAP